jgi:probable addiction module antidote protein
VEEDDPLVLIAAMAKVAKSLGVAHVAVASGIGHESLAATLSGQAAPSFETIRALLCGLGVKVAIAPAQNDAPAA